MAPSNHLFHSHLFDHFISFIKYKHKTRIIINHPLILMADDAALRTSLVCLAAIMLIVGLYTYSFKKMMATYLFGMFAVAGILLPDWEFFDRPVSQWTSPLSVPHMLPHSPPSPSRFRFYPIRTTIYTIIYGYAFYKWWAYISSS
ncbi:putative microsomal signal peptidase 12kDa subunit [Helianthus annuus]|uniref:Microsomal signal peptidase 12kDa subunit n=1 Tax=Helianthus annuus TaxID=4232 RepID=A0A251UTX1_HELAN|nr:signal peptidase complex-like protein DTM1 [Helianthus annuus]KAF5807737.1 putative microsomal signal peptidase 12kDa subunit [Helianthus annuus]